MNKHSISDRQRNRRARLTTWQSKAHHFTLIMLIGTPLSHHNDTSFLKREGNNTAGLPAVLRIRADKASRHILSD